MINITITRLIKMIMTTIIYDDNDDDDRLEMIITKIIKINNHIAP